MLQIIVVATFITSVLIMYQLFKYFTDKQNSILRLRRYINIEEIREEKRKSSKKDHKTFLEFFSKGIASAKFLNKYKRSIQQQLTRGHMLLKAEEFITICLFTSAILLLSVFLISQKLLFAVGAGIIGWLIPFFIVRSKTSSRIKYLNEQLGDAIVLISNSLKAGYSFFQAIDIVSKEMTGPIAEEFSTLQKDVNLGASTEKALENLVHRTSSDDMELVVTAVLIQRQVGGNLAEILDNISSTIRDRVKFKGEVKAITAQGRMSGLVISILPPGLGGVIYMINPEHIGLLFKDPIGIMILVYSIIMELVGIFFISKIIKIEM